MSALDDLQRAILDTPEGEPRAVRMWVGDFDGLRIEFAGTPSPEYVARIDALVREVRLERMAADPMVTTYRFTRDGVTGYRCASCGAKS